MYSLPLWRKESYQAPYQSYPEPTGYIEPTDAKRWLTSYATDLPGFRDEWRPYFPSLAGYFEGTINNPDAYMPEGMWEDMAGWYGGVDDSQGVYEWGEANQLPALGEGSYNWMSPNWWQPGQGVVGTYNPPPTPDAPDPSAAHKAYILDDIMKQGVMGRTSPGSSNLGVTPATPPPLQNFEQPMQQFGVLNQWNTMPKWDMGAGPNWAKF